MKKPLALGSALLVTTILAGPAWAQVAGGSAAGGAAAPAQSTPETAPATAASPVQTTQEGADAPAEEAVDISAPGAGDPEEIVVRGRYIPNTVRATPEVISVLSTADIARTGEGDIAGALQRVPGLSVVSGGFVYVRGLGDRYSLSLLNGSPLPSPEPLRRVVPLDIFPTSIVASAVVQKSYSPNYPGEFGGGVINLTTVATPSEPFLSVGVSLSGDSETTGKLGYTYEGSDTDFLGYDSGTRRVPSAIRDAGLNGEDVIDTAVLTSLSNAETTLLQRNRDIPANFSAEVSGGTSFDVGSDGTLGFVASAGYNSSWQTRDALQQATNDPNGALQEQFRTVLTDNRVLVNGLLGIGLDVGEHTFRLTNVYIHDTVKQGRLSSGFTSQNPVTAGQPNPLLQQNTFFFERQLYDLQGVAELDFDPFSIDIRGTYAKTKRESPYERYFGYVYDARISDYRNRLTGSDDESATIAFSDLDERIYAGGIDLAYELPFERPVTLSTGYAYSDTDRSSSRFFFRYVPLAGSNVREDVAQQRPDFLLSDFSIQTNGIVLRNQSAQQARALYDAGLKIHGGYAMAEAELLDGLRVTGGVRYEDADQVITTGDFSRTLRNNYWLPSATVTWNFAEDMQLRLHGSKTIARPQFRELAPQLYQDFTSDREFTGNPFLEDSELYNAEARYEWFLGRDQRVTLAGFYKRIDNPIEAVAFFVGGEASLQTGFSNAPRAELYGGEVEVQKYIPLEGLGGDFFSTRRLLLVGNYTYSKSELQVGNEQAVSPIVGTTLTPTPQPANLLFRDGAPLTGQSDHIVNLQFGIEDTERLSQVTLLLNYASERVTNRGPVSSGVRLPDLIEKPGLRLDLVVREAIDLFGSEMELKLEARNLTGEDYREVQEFANGQTLSVNSYDVGRSLSLGVSVKF